MSNNIIAHFEKSSFYSNQVWGLTQWDRGKYLHVEGLNLTESAEVHFSLQDIRGTAVRAETTIENGVAVAKIPQFILENQSAGKDKYSAYVFIYENNEDDAETIAKAILLIRTRPKPDDYVYEEEEVKRWSKLDADKISKPLAAKVGQVVAVKAVDENGYPTEFEAVDAATGGGISIEKIEQTKISEEDNGENVLTITTTDGGKTEFVVRNGSQGTPGTPGAPGQPGSDYIITDDDYQAIANVVLAGLTNAETEAM